MKIILVNGTKCVGKDTFFTLLKGLNPSFKRYAFADSLKNMLDDACYKLFGKFINQLTPEEKEIFRPIMLATGKVARDIDGDFWIKKVNGEICRDPYRNSIPVITDCRYVNEYNYFKKIYGNDCILVSIKRNGAPEPTEEEKKHNPAVEALADYSFTWDTDPTLHSLSVYANDFYNNYFHSNPII